MSDTSSISVYIHNDLNYDIQNYWLTHKTSDDDVSTDYTGGGTLTQGSNTSKVSFNLVSNTKDYWTVMWTDNQGNLWGTEQFFSAQAFIKDGDIEIQLLGNGSVVEVAQGSVDGKTDILQYGALTS